MLRFPGCSHLHSLELSYDGPIPPRLKDAARQLDWIEAHKAEARSPGLDPAEKPAAVRLANIRPTDGVAMALMLRTIFDRAPEGRIMREDFERIGLPAEQIERLHKRACARAVALDPRIGELLQMAA